MSRRNDYKLFNEVMFRSVSNNWEDATNEWILKGSYIMDDHECTCGKKHITEVNLIENKLTGSQLEVGSECVKKFIGEDPTGFFTGLRRIQRNRTGSIGRKALEFVRRHGILNYQEYKWYYDNHRNSKYDKSYVKNTRHRLNDKIISFEK